MNKFDEIYDIYLAHIEDIEDIMQFIKENWNEQHILANDRKFFEYEHVINNKVTFLIARDKKTRRICSVLGYILASDNYERLDVWTGLWKTAGGTMPLLGTELMKRLPILLGARTLIGVGDNPNTTIKLLKALVKSQCYISKMKHYYVMSKILPPQIADIKKCVDFKYCTDIITNVHPISCIKEINKYFDFSDYLDDIPYKDEKYFERRYFKHPIYRYQVYFLSQDKDKKGAVLVTRVQEYQGSKVLRIIDYVGEKDNFRGLGKFFEEKLKEYEYIDFYTLGFEDKILEEAGMVLIDENDLNIIPDYFNPFKKENIDIWVDSSNSNTFFVKGDGDQDRPSMKNQV